MKQITFKRLEIKNFKATASRTIESIPDGGLVITARNGAGKSSILEAIVFALGGSFEASRIINQTTKSAASVSLTIQHQEGTDTFTRVLTPTLNEAGKVTASTSSYTISGHPKKQTEYQSAVAQLFDTKACWMYLLRPELNAGNKDARNILLSVAGAPSESEFMKQHNPALAQEIGTTSFSDFEGREKQSVQVLGKKIQEIPGRIEENAAMLQEVPEMEDEAPIHQRIAEIRAIFKGVDQANSERAEEFNKVACEAQALRNEAAQLRNKAAGLVAEANRQANTARNEAILAAQKHEYELTQHNAKIAQYKMSIDRVRIESQRLAEQYQAADNKVNTIFAEYQAKAAEIVTADGFCAATGVTCPALQEKGLQAAEMAKEQALQAIKEKGKAAVRNRDEIKQQQAEKETQVLSLIAECQKLEKKDLGQAPIVPEEKVLLSTPESLHLMDQANRLDETAENLIKSNKLEVAQRPADLMEELQQLNEKLTRGMAAAQARKNNDKIQQRIEELHEEEKQLRLAQLKHQKAIAELKEFYRNYADSVTGMVNQLFDGTPYTIKLFDANMSNEKGTPVMQPMVNDSSNLSTAENLLFWIRFVERVLSVKYGLRAPFLVDNAECVSDETQFGSKHQKFIAAVDRCDLDIFPLTQPNTK